MSIRGQGSRFAHLIRGARTEDKDEDDKKDDARKAEDDDDKKKDEDDDKAKSKSKAKPKKADGDEDDDDTMSDGDDDSDEKDRDDDKASAARLRERGRCAAIFASPAAALNPAAAAELAFGSTMPRGQAIKLLGAVTAGLTAPKPSGRSSIDQRMASVATPSVGSGAGADSELKPHERLVRAAAALRGRTG